MVVDLRIVGEGHADHEDQRQDGQRADKDHRRGHQQAVEVVVQQALQVFSQGVQVFAGLVQAFGLVGAFQGAAPDPEHHAGQDDGGQAVQQQQDRLVALGVGEHLQLLVPDFLALHRAQAAQHGQVVEAVQDHKGDVGDFRRQEQQPLGHLFVHHIAKTHHERRNTRFGAALTEGSKAGVRGGEFQIAAHFCRTDRIHP